MKYNFYESGAININPIDNKYIKISNPFILYDILSNLWSKETCAPRMRNNWSIDNITLGQCSITAFLAQDIFGGDVYGIALGDGNFHCFNVVGKDVFDLTSEQFLPKKLNYDECVKQSRDIHFSKEEKKNRYEYLKNKLDLYLKEIK